MADQEDLGRTGDFQDLGTAPKDGSLIVVRLENGEECLARWRSKPRIIEEDGPDDQREHPYWARWHTDEVIHPKAWAPTHLEVEDAVDRV